MVNMWMNGIMGVVVGDALGLPVQFAPREERDADPVTDMRGHGVFDMPAGSWSDDSSLTLAALDALNNYGYDPDRIMQNFVSWLKEGKFTPLGFSYDIGGACFDSITEYSRSHNWKTCGRTGENENGNGSLMRIMPFCLYCYCKQKAGRMTDTEAIELIREASAFTHAHERSRIACVLYYFIVRSVLDGKMSSNKCLQRGLDDGFRLYAENGGDMDELEYFNRLRDLSLFKDVPRDEISGSGYVLHSLEAAVWCLLNTYNYADTVLLAVNLGLDTDTTAAITGGLAGLIYGEISIPKRWKDQILKKEMIEEMCNMAASKYNY